MRSGCWRGEQVNPEGSVYAQHIVTLLREKVVGQVLNRSEIIVAEHSIEYERRFRLEPEYVGVLLAALVYHGDVVVAYPGMKITAANLDEMAKKSAQDLAAFKHVELPKDPHRGACRALHDARPYPGSGEESGNSP